MRENIMKNDQIPKDKVNGKSRLGGVIKLNPYRLVARFDFFSITLIEDIHSYTLR
jgi:hypothetical protein